MIDEQCCDSFRYTAKWLLNIYIFFQILSPFRLLHDLEQNSLWQTVGPCWLLILNLAVSTCQSQTPSVPTPHWPLPLLTLSSFIPPFFLDSTYKWYHVPSVSLNLTYFTQYDNLWVHRCCYKWHYFILFYGWVIFNYTCIYSFLYSMAYHWIFNIVPCATS